MELIGAALVHGYVKPLITHQISRTAICLKPLVLLDFQHIHAPTPLWRVPDAVARLRRMLPAMPEGAALERFLPETMDNGPDAVLRRRAALASTLLAGLELGREGAASLSQERAFGAIVVAPTGPAHSAHGGTEAREAGRPDWRAARGIGF